MKKVPITEVGVNCRQWKHYPSRHFGSASPQQKHMAETRLWIWEKKLTLRAQTRDLHVTLLRYRGLGRKWVHQHQQCHQEVTHPLPDQLGSMPVEHWKSEEAQEGHTSILAIMSKPAIKGGNERHLLNLNFNNPVLHSCLLLRHRYYYTPGTYNLLIPLLEFSALCFLYNNTTQIIQPSETKVN